MVDVKELGIKVTGDVTDITSSLDELVNKFNEIVDKTVQIMIEVNDEQLNNLQSEITNLDNQSLNETVEVDDTQLIEAASHANELDNLVLEEEIVVDDSQIEEVSTELESLDGYSINETITIDDSSVIDATNDLNELGTTGDSSANDISSAMERATKSVDELGNQAQDTANKTQEIGDQAEVTGDKGEDSFTQMAIAIGAVTAGLEIIAEDLIDVNNRFEKMSWAAGSIPEDKLRDMVATLSNTHFPTEEVLDYITLLKQMGVTSEDSLMRGADAMNKMELATGSSEETMKKFANSMKVMGVDLNNLPSIFNAVAYAQANIIGGFETYVQWMQKFDSQFKELGLSIDQTVILIAAATKKWGGGRAAYTGLNEALKESNGNLDILEQKLGLQPGALDKAAETTAKYSGRVEKNSEIVRGNTTTIQKSGEAIEDWKTKYGDAIQVAAGFGAVIGGLAGIFGLVIPKILSYLDDIWKPAVSLEERYTGWWKNFIGKLKNGGLEVLNIIKGWIGWGEEAGKAGDGITKALEGKVEDTTLIGRIKGFGSRVLDTIKGWMGWGDEAEKAAENIGKATDDGVKVASEWLDGAGNFVKEETVTIGRKIEEGAGKAGESAGKSGDTIIGKLISSLEKFKIPSSVSRIGELIPEGLSLGILKGIPKLIGDAAIPLAVIQSAAEGLYHYTEMLSSNPVELLWNIYLGGTYNLLPQQIRDFIDSVTGWATPEKLGKAVFGEDFYNGFVTYFTDNVVNPFRKAVDNFIPNLQAWLSGKTKINLLGILFGGPGATDPNDISPVSMMFDSIKGVVTGFVSWLTGVPMQIVPFDWNNVIGNLGLIWTNIQTQFGAFVAWLVGIPTQIGTILSSLPIMVQGAFSTFTQWLTDLPVNIGRAVGDAIILVLEGLYNILKFLTDLPGQITALLGNLGSAITGVLGNIIPTITAAWANLTKSFTDFEIWLSNFPAEAVKYITELGNQITKALMSIPDMIKGGIQAIIDSFNGFIKFLSDLPDEIGKYLSELKDSIIDELKKIPDKVKKLLTDIWTKFEDFIDWIKSLPDTIKKWVSKAYDDLINYLRGIPDKVKAELEKIWKKFTDFISWIGTLPSQLYNAIVNAWDGFLKGLKEKFPQIEGWLQKIRDLFPHSPPKTGPLIDIMDWGGNMASAIQSGFDDGFPKLASNFANRLQSIKGLAVDLTKDLDKLNMDIPERQLNVINTAMNSLNEPSITNDVSITLKVDTVNAKDNKEAKESLRNVENEVEDIFKRQLGQKGIPIFKRG